ncbi:MAG: MFS transporter, partial [Pseudomonadota bacterium]
SNTLLLERRVLARCGAQTFGAFADNKLRQAAIIAIFAMAAVSYGSADFTMPSGLGHAAPMIVSVGFTLPILIFSPLSGQIADRFDRDMLVRKLKLIELAVMAYASLCFFIGNGPQLIFALFLMGTQSAFFSPVRMSLMPQYYRTEELPFANGVYNAALFVAIVAGLSLGGALILLDDGRLYVSLILVAAAAIGALFAMGCPKAPVNSTQKINWNIPVVAVRLFQQAAAQRGVLYPMLGIGWFWMISAASLALLPALVRDSLQASDTAINQCIAVSSIGAGMGSLIAGLIVSRVKDSFLFAGAAVAANAVAWVTAWFVLKDYAIPASGFFSFGNLPLMLVLTASALTNGMFVVPLMAALQSRAPQAIRAQIMGASNMTNGGLATVGALGLLLPMSLGLAPHELFLIFGALQLGLCIFMWRRKGAIRAAAEPAPANPLSQDVVTPSFSESQK